MDDDAAGEFDDEELVELASGLPIFVDCLARGWSQQRAAERAGFSLRTGQRRLKEDAVQAMLKRRKHELREEFRGSMQHIASQALEVIEEAMSPGAPFNVRLQAASLALRYSTASYEDAIHEHNDALEGQLAKLTATVNEMNRLRDEAERPQ